MASTGRRHGRRRRTSPVRRLRSGRRRLGAFLEGGEDRAAVSVASGCLLEVPAVAVGILEEGERVPIPTLPVDPLTVLEVPDLADLEASFDELGPGGLDVG